MLPFGRWGLPGPSVVAVGALPWLLLSLMSGCSLILHVALRFGLLGAVCCFVSTAPVCVGCFLLFPATVGLASVLPSCVVAPRSWAGFPSWSSTLWGFPLLFALLHLLPPLRLFATPLDDAATPRKALLTCGAVDPLKPFNHRDRTCRQKPSTGTHLPLPQPAPRRHMTFQCTASKDSRSTPPPSTLTIVLSPIAWT